MTKRLTLVVGASRSGTSLFSGMLQAVGAHIPQPEIEADDSNPRGFSEPRWVVDFHSSLLRAASVHVGDARPSAWTAVASVARDRQPRRQLERWLRHEFRGADDVVVKDPRLVWFTSLWERAAAPVASVRYATVLRHPLEVVTSQQTYYVQWDDNSRTAGWLNTMLFAERATRTQTRAFVRYDDLLADPMATLATVCDALDLPLLEQVRVPQMRAVMGLVDPTLRRSTASWSEMRVDDRLVKMAEEAWALLARLPVVGEAEVRSVQDDLDRVRQEYVELYQFAEGVSQFSLYAAQRGANFTTRLANRWAPNQQPLTPRMAADKVIRKVRRRLRRAAHDVRPSGGSSSGDTG